MDFDMFLTSPRWEILQIVAEKPSSPVEIAGRLGTTVSYVSQQMRLLEVAGLVTKERTGAVEKGKPRTLFSISKEFVYLTLISGDKCFKKQIKVNEEHKAILKIWNIEDDSLHSYIQRIYWRLYDNIKDIKGIFVETKSPYKIIVVSDSKKLKQDIEKYVKELDRKLDVSFVSKSGKLDDYVCIYYHLNKLKGGQND